MHFARILCSRAIYVFYVFFLFCFHFYFVSSCLVVPQQDVQRFIIEIFKDFQFLNESYQVNISSACWICEKVFVSLRILLSMKFGFKNLCKRKVGRQTNCKTNKQVSFPYFLIYFSDLLITFETYYPWSLDWRKWFASWW